MNKFSPFFIALLTTSTLTACVTQNYGNDKDTPLIENESSNNEIAMTRISLGLGYLKMGNTQQAKLNLEKAKRFAPNLVQVYTSFAHYYDTVGEPDLAIKAYEQALSLNSQDADTLNNYGVFLCRQGLYVPAEQQMLKAIAIPSYILVAQSYENLALCQLKAKEFTKAQTYLEKAIAHSPNRASSLLQMMQLQYAKSDYKSAQTYLYRYEKATRRFSSNALALAFKIFSKQGNQRVAKNYANMLVKMFPNSFEAKQYILNELYQISADKLAEEYRISFFDDKTIKSTKSQKRVVVLSPKTAPTDENASLSIHGLKPMMENSVMATEKQEAESELKESQLTEVDDNSQSELEQELVDSQPELEQELIDSQSELEQELVDSEPELEQELVDSQPELEQEVVDNQPEEVLVTEIEDKVPTDVVMENDPEIEVVEEEPAQALIVESTDSDDKLVEEVVEVQAIAKDNKATMAIIPTHIVVRGDNLFIISRKNNIVMESLAKWNLLSPPYPLKVGDVLFLADPKLAEQSKE